MADSDLPPVTDQITAVTKLIGKLTSEVYEYLWGLDDVPDELQKLVDELQSTGKVLAGLRNVSLEDKEFVFKKLNVPDGPLAGCATELKRLQLRMDSDKGVGGDRARLIWLLDKKQLLPYLTRIEKHKDVFTLALQLVKDQSKLSKVMAGYIQNTDSEKDKHEVYHVIYSPAIKNAESMKERKRDMNWLFSGDFEARYLGIQERRLEGTGEWLLQSPIFQGWMEGEPGSQILWGRAAAGAGKTYICSKVIDYVKAQANAHNYAVAYIFFDPMERYQKSSKDIVSCLIAQLACQARSFSYVRNTLASRLTDSDLFTQQQLEPNFEKLSTSLIETSKLFDRVFVVFDGLDVSGQQKDLFSLVHTLAEENISVFLTSHLQSGDMYRSFVMVSKIDLLARAEDIKIYIEYKIEASPRIKRLLALGKNKDRFICELTDCANGIFLFAHLLMVSLVEQPTVNHIFKELQTLKPLVRGKDSYSAIYTKVVENIRKKEKNCATMALKTLIWLVKAQRILTVNELREAISIEADRYELDEADLPDTETLLDLCAGLITVDKGTSMVRLIHHSAQECLLKSQMLPLDADYQVAMACLTYLSFNAFSQDPWRGAEADRLKKHPFLEYAAKYLSTHLNACDHSLTTKAFLRFARNPRQIASYLRLLGDYHLAGSDKISPLHVSTLVGHLPAVRILREDEAESFYNQRTPLHEAVKGNHIEVVRLLLQYEDATGIHDEKGKTVLHWAARKGFKDIIKLLLVSGADIKEYGYGRQTALHEAARGGHEEVVKLLLERGVPAWSREECGQTAFHIAAEGGHIGIVKRLLKTYKIMSAEERESGTSPELIQEKGHAQGCQVTRRVNLDIGVSAQDHELLTPLHLAVWGGHTDVVRLLLQEGADVSAEDTGRETALHLAPRGGNTDVVQLLLHYGADILAKTRVGVTTLHRAAIRGYTNIVQMLLDHGADITAQVGTRTALELSIADGHEQSVRLLLDTSLESSIADRLDEMLTEAANGGYSGIAELLLNRGANPSSTALYKAAENGHLDVVKLLLSGNTDTLLRHDDGLLHIAAYNGHQDVVQLLVQNGADIQARDKDQNTTLHKAAHPRVYGRQNKGNEGIVHFLLEAGADVSAKDRYGNTAIIIAARGGSREVAQLLIAHGADVAGHNIHGQTALHNASSRGRTDVVKLLLDHGADISARNKNHETALLLASREGHTDVAQQLLKYGADISEVDKDGMTSMFLAADNDRSEVVRLLIRCGADITEMDKERRTAFILAVEKGYSQVVEVLLRSGADISEKDSKGQTALFIAAEEGHPDVVRILLENGANISEINADGQTALHMAAEGWREECRDVFQLLIDKGVNEFARDKHGKIAFIEYDKFDYGGWSPPDPDHYYGW